MLPNLGSSTSCTTEKSRAAAKDRGMNLVLLIQWAIYSTSADAKLPQVVYPVKMTHYTARYPTVPATGNTSFGETSITIISLFTPSQTLQYTAVMPSKKPPAKWIRPTPRARPDSVS